eukprot:scaffold1385_cov403-Prasinococcus_capsulatus_cf.AAC.3
MATPTSLCPGAAGAAQGTQSCLRGTAARAERPPAAMPARPPLVSTAPGHFAVPAPNSVTGRRSLWSRPVWGRSLHASPRRVLAPVQSAVQEVPTAEEAPEIDPLSVTLPTSDDSEDLLKIRHTSAHVMAMAVQRLYKDAQVTIGPWIENGFYYDFDMKQAVTDSDLKKIRKEMIKIINKKLPLVREEVSREEAERRIKEINEPYKLEILEAIKEEPITIYRIGDEVGSPQLPGMHGPHVGSTGDLNPKALKLESVAGAYWRGDESRPMLQRIYGTAWQTAEQLDIYTKQQEEAKRRDHRRIGKDLNLFSIQQEAAGGGLVFWHPKGAMMRHIIENYWKETHMERGYELLYTPHVAKVDLWKTSGHFSFYKESMFDQMQVEDESYQLKPMNCPFHIQDTETNRAEHGSQVYKEGLHSYKELPIRWAELGTVYRYERSGTMHGLFRVRGFTQDDGHIFCLPSQLSDEILGVLNLVEEVLSRFGFTKYEVNLSTRPEKSVGGDEVWNRSTDSLKDALNRKGWEYSVDEGGGAFYGPKIDFKILDAIGRKWQCSTIQVDFNLPERFDLEYVDKENNRERPIMIHRAIFGSLERFYGILIENYAGEFPLWIAPVQARLLPVTDEAVPYAREVVRKMKAFGLRAEIVGGERLGKLVRNAEKDRVPVMGIIGMSEVENAQISVRTRAGGELGPMGVDERCNCARPSKASLLAAFPLLLLASLRLLFALTTGGRLGSCRSKEGFQPGIQGTV